MPNRRQILRAGAAAAMAGTTGLPPFLWSRQATAAGAAQGIAMHGTPRLGPGDPAVAYADPSAPKGGQLLRSVVGSFDNLNPNIITGQAALGVAEYHLPSLMVRSWDEPFTLYSYVAATVETPEDRKWVEFTLNESARWHDGTPITIDDLVFSFEILRDKGGPGRRRNHARVTETVRVGDRGVRFVIGPEGDRETPLILALMPVISKAWYESHPFEETTLDPPLGAGPYRISKVDPGRRIEFERVPDWWGAELPGFRGQMNFDLLRFDYFRDASVDFEAFRAGEYNYRVETDADRWATGYDFPAAADGRVKRIEAPHGRPSGMLGFAFNTRRPQFSDIKVREALQYAFDFAFVNRTYLHGAFLRNDSFFANSVLASSGLPEGRELEILEPFRDRLSPRIFEQPFTLPSTDEAGAVRRNLREATRLLEEAGWQLTGGRRVRASDGMPFSFEIMLRSAGDERVALALAENLKRLGIEASVRTVDSAQYASRLESFDFDMIVHRWFVSLSPGSEQLNFWGSAAATTNGSRNFPGIADPVIDALAGVIADAVDYETLTAATRALDRVLLWQFPVIPLYYNPRDYIAYWGELGFVEKPPLYGAIATINAWWSS